MWKYVILISYVGSNFYGWQKQKQASLNSEGRPGSSKPKSSIQETLEKAILKMTGEQISVVGSGRTDSGVHAAGQVGHFVLREKRWDPQILFKGLNGILPASIRILSVADVLIDFHAQRSAEKKQYSYYFQQGPCPLPHLDPVSWWIRKTLDVRAMSQAAQTLIGQRDFKPFRASGAHDGTTVREILAAEIQIQPISFPGGTGVFPSSSDLDLNMSSDSRALSLIRFRVVGTGFLKQMVRGIAGTLLQIGENRRSPDCMQEILTSLDRSMVGPTAPARGLWLEKVWYPERFGLESALFTGNPR